MELIEFKKRVMDIRAYASGKISLTESIEKLYKDISIPMQLPVKPDACEHNYQIAKKDYYKPDGGQNAFGKTYNQERTYSTLFCTKCGETKEIITS